MSNFNLFTTLANYSSNGEFFFQHEYIDSIFLKVNVLICIIGLAGNTLVVVFLSCFGKTQDINVRVTNMFNRNLAIADLSVLICLFIIIFFIDAEIIDAYDNQQRNKVIWTAFWLAYFATEFISTMFIFIIAVDRYFFICHPILSRKYRTPQMVHFVSISTWVGSILITWPILFHVDPWEFPIPNEYSSNEFLLHSDDPDQGDFLYYKIISYHIFLTVMQIDIPLCFIASFHYAVIKKVRSQPDTLGDHRKATRVVMTAIAAYVFCLLPHCIEIVIMRILFNNGTLKVLLIQTASSLSYLNSAINPIFYVFSSKKFKNSFGNACRCFVTTQVSRDVQQDGEMC